LTVKNLVYWLL